MDSAISELLNIVEDNKMEMKDNLYKQLLESLGKIHNCQDQGANGSTEDENEGYYLYNEEEKQGGPTGDGDESVHQSYELDESFQPQIGVYDINGSRLINNIVITNVILNTLLSKNLDNSIYVIEKNDENQRYFTNVSCNKEDLEMYLSSENKISQLALIENSNSSNSKYYLVTIRENCNNNYKIYKMKPNEAKLWEDINCIVSGSRRMRLDISLI